MRTSWFVRRALVVVALIGLPAAVFAQTFPAGSGTLAGKASLSIKGCGKGSDRGATSYPLDGAGSFVEDGSIAATAIPQGSSGRVFNLSYDAANLAIIRAIFEDVASEFCQSQFTISSFQASGSLKLNKRNTRAKVRQSATLTGTDGVGGSHTGRFKAKDSGAWTLAVQ